MEQDVEQLKSLKKEQTQLSDRLNSLVFQTIIIFGAPAVLGYFIGLYLERMGISKIIAFILPLAGTFVLSWWILLRKLKKLTREVKIVEEQIKQLTQKE